MDGASKNINRFTAKHFISFVSEAKDKNKIKNYKPSAESDISLEFRYFIMANRQRHIIITLAWIRIHCEIKNGKTRFTSWGKSMTES